MKLLVTTLRLFLMMFIQFFIWGAWYVTAPTYLSQKGFGGDEFGWTYSVGPIAGIIAPFFLGMIADRYFATQRLLGVLHLLGAAAMFGAIHFMKEGGSPAVINLVFFMHMLCFYPTLGLTNSLALSTMENPEWQFPWVRVGGTIGWIVAGLSLSWQGWGASLNMFYMSAIAALVMGVYCFTLPHTPPPSKGKSKSVGDIFGMEALRFLMQRPSYVVFIICSTLICIPLAFYYQLAARSVEQSGISNYAAVMTYGQFSEIIFMVAMPFFFYFLGVKWMLFVGMLAWVARYILFAVGAPAPDPVIWMMFSGVILHGICYDFFFVTGQIYTDRVAPKHIRAQAQGLLVFFTLGIGMLIGAQAAGRVEKMYTPPKSTEKSEQVKALAKEIEELQEKIDAGGSGVASLSKQVNEKTAEKDKLRLEAMQYMEWKYIWGIPAIFAGIVLVVFTFLFRDDTKTTTDKDPTEGASYA